MLSRRAVGTGVAGGMLAAAAVGIFVIPALYVVFQTLRERVKGRRGSGGTGGHGTPEAVPAQAAGE
jgi:hypothetical protein